MSVVKGFVRTPTAVVNTDMTEFELIRQRRAQKKNQDQVTGEVAMLREMIAQLTERVSKLEERNG
jgi:hypothetical protein